MNNKKYIKKKKKENKKKNEGKKYFKYLFILNVEGLCACQKQYCTKRIM